MRKRIVALLAVGAAAVTIAAVGIGNAAAETKGTAGMTGAAEQAGMAEEGKGSSQVKTLRNTQRIIEALERKDLETVSAMTADQAVLQHALALSGDRDEAARFVGKEQVMGYIGGVFTMFGTINFTDVRVTVSADGRSSFVQANGDFTTADGRPYLNVYLFRYDWQNGQAVSIEEYANPVTFCQTVGHPTCS
jgi:ketosteroid isomerase-like protein